MDIGKICTSDEVGETGKLTKMTALLENLVIWYDMHFKLIFPSGNGTRNYKDEEQISAEQS
jgi:hypothetical protein